MTTEEKTVGLLRGHDDPLRTFAGSFRLLNFGRSFISQKPDPSGLVGDIPADCSDNPNDSSMQKPTFRRSLRWKRCR